jgi:glutathione synthase/RimK-type ligase-like ATP-grasp enzyme
VLALVTCRAAREFDADLPLLQAELPSASIVEWDDHTIEWHRFDVVVIRSAWDYHRRRDRFLAWARHVTDVAALWNPLSVIEWNTDKHYLADLRHQGVPIVPTTYVDGEAADAPDAVFHGDVVVKPTIGAGSNGVFRSRGDATGARAHARALRDSGVAAMVQPYVTAVDEVGETGLVYLGGSYSHAFRKRAILAGPVEFEGGVAATEEIANHVATEAERALGDRVLTLLPETAYARIDLLPTGAGPVVLELELTEPSLYLDQDRRAAARAAAVFRSLAG